MEKIKVIVFEIYPMIEKTVRELLKSIPGIEIVDHNVNNTEEALELILVQRPDVVFLGNDFPGIDGYFFTKTIRQQAPLTQVIMFAEVASADSVRQAMRSGACDFISQKNLTVEELSPVLEHAVQLVDEEKRIKTTTEKEKKSAIILSDDFQTKKRSRIITVYSPKGGAGVSTITVNLAWSLTSTGNKVLIVDGDFLFGDMGVLLNQLSNHSIKDLVRVKGELEIEIIKEVINHGEVDLLAAPSDVESSIEITGPTFENIVKKVSQLDYDFILINTTSHLTDSTIVALESAEIILLIGTQEIATIRALRTFLDLMGALSIPHEKLALVINRFQNDSVLAAEKFNEFLKLDVFHAIPLDFGTVVLANNVGIPFVIEHKDLPISREIESLAIKITKGKKQNKASFISNLRKNLSMTRL
jgi:pilus assembly protein CpaE